MPSHFDDLRKATQQRLEAEKIEQEKRERLAQNLKTIKEYHEEVIRGYSPMVMSILTDFSDALGYGGAPIFLDKSKTEQDSYWELRCKKPYYSVAYEEDSSLFYSFKVWIEFDATNRPRCLKCQRTDKNSDKILKANFDEDSLARVLRSLV